MRLRYLPDNSRPQYSHFFLEYTKYFCKKVSSLERKFSRQMLLPHYAALPI